MLRIDLLRLAWSPPEWVVSDPILPYRGSLPARLMGSRKGRCAGRPDDVFGEGCYGWVRRAKTTPSRCAGVVAAARAQGKRTQHGKPHGVVRDDQTGRPRGMGRALRGGGEVRSTAEAG